ncbi:MAG TPA: hypothetical protein PLC28_21290 [Spirochaetota bacterium]|nr:hypothetical protein [Spirochaetota bacterium]HPL19130.1 hypothetical protein [Spirochaetota bacterium]HRS79030.1 hypothetical protein [Spirochaetota bacterium]
MAAKSVNLIKYLIKGKESRRKTLLKELAAVDGQIKKLKNDMKSAAKREDAAKKAKAKKKKK